ncbi:MAG: VanZ family protein [Campylobacterota bacterium]|nr:VanZ family protein [Campylobacterota bacterium]
MYKLALLICVVSIEFLATTTTVHIEMIESFWDKGNHFIAFFVLYILLSLAYKNLSILIKVIILMAFGLQIEIVQSFIDGRFFSLLDVVADGVGILMGVVAWRFRPLLKNEQR